MEAVELKRLKEHKNENGMEYIVQLANCNSKLNLPLCKGKIDYSFISVSCIYVVHYSAWEHFSTLHCYDMLNGTETGWFSVLLTVIWHALYEWTVKLLPTWLVAQHKNLHYEPKSRLFPI